MALAWRQAAAGAAVGAGTSAVATLALLRRYLRSELRSPRLVHKGFPEEGGSSHEEDTMPDEERELLLQVRLLLRDYWPHPLLEFSGYISSMWSGLWVLVPTSVSGRVEALTLSDGGTVSLHWSEPPARPTGRAALVLPGLNNDSRTGFVQETMRHLSAHGIQAVALNFRGCGMDFTSPRFAAADSWRDLPEVVAHLERTLPHGTRLFGVGYSMGGGLLLKHLGEEGPGVRLAGVVTIAAPVDYVALRDALQSSFKKRAVSFITASAVKALMMGTAMRSPLFTQVDWRRAILSGSLRELEEATICPAHGYKDTLEYYTLNDPRPLLQRICVPTLLINAEDDPVVSFKTMPLEDLRSNPCIYTALTRRGGHIGFGSGGLGAGSWTDSMATKFLEAVSSRGSGRRPAHSRL